MGKKKHMLPLSADTYLTFLFIGDTSEKKRPSRGLKERESSTRGYESARGEQKKRKAKAKSPH